MDEEDLAVSQYIFIYKSRCRAGFGPRLAGAPPVMTSPPACPRPPSPAFLRWTVTQLPAALEPEDPRASHLHAPAKAVPWAWVSTRLSEELQEPAEVALALRSRPQTPPHTRGRVVHSSPCAPAGLWTYVQEPQAYSARLPGLIINS